MWGAPYKHRIASRESVVRVGVETLNAAWLQSVTAEIF